MNALKKLEDRSEKFVSIYQAVHGCSKSDAENYFQVELFNFKQGILQNSYLSDCEEISVIGTFLEVISNGLSFDRSANHIYLIPRNTKVGNNWVKRLTYSYAADGLIQLTLQAGSISNCSTPTVVFEGDEIKIRNINGTTEIDHSPSIPRKTGTILGGYCVLTLPNGSKDAFWFDISEIERLKEFSKKANKSKNNPEGKTNELYSSGASGQIDLGFLRTKIVKAALRNLPKRKTMQDNLNEELPELDPFGSQQFPENAPTTAGNNGIEDAVMDPTPEISGDINIDNIKMDF